MGGATDEVWLAKKRARAGRGRTSILSKVVLPLCHSPLPVPVPGCPRALLDLELSGEDRRYDQNGYDSTWPCPPPGKNPHNGAHPHIRTRLNQGADAHNSISGGIAVRGSTSLNPESIPQLWQHRWCYYVMSCLSVPIPPCAAAPSSNYLSCFSIEVRILRIITQRKYSHRPGVISMM